MEPEVTAMKARKAGPTNATNATASPASLKHTETEKMSPPPAAQALADGVCKAKCAGTRFEDCKKGPTEECDACAECILIHTKHFCDTHDPEEFPCCKKTSRGEQDLCNSPKL